VCGIIVVIAGIAIPGWKRARESAQKSALINEIRNNADAFQNYATDHANSLPASVAAYQQIPNGMQPYMPQNSSWTGSPQGGGYWTWLNNTPGAETLPNYGGFIGLYQCGLPIDQIQDIDTLLDDGNLSTGAFQYTDGFISYGIQ